MRYPFGTTTLLLLTVLIATTPNIWEATLLGTIDTLSISAFIVALGLISLIVLPSPFGHISAGLILSLAITYNIAAALYFHFLRAYPLLDYLPVIISSTNQSLVTTLALLLVFFLLSYACYFAWRFLSINTSATKSFVTASLLVITFIGTQQQYKQLYRFSEVTDYQDTSALAFLFRSTVNADFFYQDMESKRKNQLVALANSLSGQDELPEEFQYESIKKALGNKESPQYTVPYPKSYPLYKVPANNLNSPGNKQSVIVLVLEGVRASEMGAYGSGNSATPNLDRYADKFTVIPNHYSTAPLTVKSEYAINCSALDYFSGSPISSRQGKIQRTCLPNILATKGYETFWFHGNDKEFYTREPFLTQIGINNIYDQLAIIEDGGPDAELGWGLPDEDLFQYSLDKLEQHERPFYAEILTLSNHAPFNFDWGIDIPESVSYSDNEFHNNYRQGIYYTDYAVGIFLDRFFSSDLAKNTHLIITGDHGVWAFADEDNESTISKDERFFRVPLYLYSPEKQIKPTNYAISHLDIAPTILDLLDLSHSNAFMGHSLSKPDADILEGRIIYNFYDRMYSFRVNNRSCVSVRACFRGEQCPKMKANIRADLNPASMMCSDLKASQSFELDTQPHYFLTADDNDRALMDYSQLVLIHPAEPTSDKDKVNNTTL